MEEKLNLLIIDDEQEALEVLEVLFEEDYNVIKAKSGEEALKIMEKNPVHIILCDQRMPNMTGDEVLARIRLLYPDTVRIMITAYSDMPALIRSVNEGQIFGYIQKPWNPDELILFVDRAAKFYNLNLQNRKLFEEFKKINLNFDEMFRRKTQELENEKQKLKELTITDDLTGIYNLRYLRMRWQQEYDRFLRYKMPFSIVIADIDNFKRVNDEYGHLVGDKILIHVARLIRESIRIVDVAGRYGGEEFCIIAPNTREEGAAILAERVRQNIQNYNYVQNGFKTWISASFGVSSNLKENPITIDEMIRRADEAMYAAKKQGKNRVITWDQLKSYVLKKPQTTFVSKKEPIK